MTYVYSYYVYLPIPIMYVLQCLISLQVMLVGPHGCLVPVVLHVDRVGLQ